MVSIQNRLQEHLAYFKEAYPQDWFVIALQGSQNYGIADEESDIDSKILIIPQLEDIIFNRKPVSNTLEMPDNNEHVDCKDIREYFKIFRKSNINFVEILFTDYWIVNNQYQDLWLTLRQNAESLARMNRFAAVSCMGGMAHEKFKAMTHEYPSRMHMIEKFGYDCYSEDTLFLTSNGWKLYDEIQDDEQLATINPDTLSLEFQSILNRTKQENKETYTVESRYSKFEITSGHNLFCSNIININKYGDKYSEERKNWHLEPLENNFKKLGSSKKKHVMSFPYNTNKDNLDYSDDFLLYLGGFISEGTLAFRGENHTIVKASRICQTDKGKPEFFEVFNNLDLNLKKYTYLRKTCVETVWCSNKKIAEQCYYLSGHTAKNKYIDNKFMLSLSKRQCRLILKTMLLGDGTKDKDSDRWIYYTSSYQLALDTLTLAHLAGYEANLLGGKDGYYYPKGNSQYGNTRMWQVCIKEKELSPHYIYLSPTAKHSSIKKHQTNQTVVCFTVANGTLVTMKDGKTACQGNCKQLSHLVRIFYFVQMYINGTPYKNCIYPKDEFIRNFLLRLKRDGNGLDKQNAINYASSIVDSIDTIVTKFRLDHDNHMDEEMDELLDDILYDTMCRSLRSQLL